MDQRVIISPFTRLKLRAVAFLCTVILAFVVSLLSVAVLVDWFISWVEKLIR